MVDLHRELKKVDANETKGFRNQLLVMSGGLNLTIQLKNYYNIQYIGDIYLGPNN